MKRRIGILTSGGDCPGLNATIRGVAKACYERFGEDNVEIVGISNGYYGLINNLCKDMAPSSFSGILTQGGTIFGTKRQPFKMMQVIGDDNVDKVKNMIERQKTKYGWEFLFLGANMDAVETAGTFGIAAERAVTYRADSRGTRLNYDVLSEAISDIRCDAALSPSWKSRIEQNEGSKQE